MGNINNSIWGTEGGSFNCTRCENDVPFAMPIRAGDEIFIQLPFAEWFPGSTVQSVDIVDMGGNVILPDIFAAPGTYATTTYGPAYYAIEAGRLIIKIPPIACAEATVEDAGFCMVSLEQIGPQRFAQWFNSRLPGGSLFLHYDGRSYDIYSGDFPAGGKWLGGKYRQHMQLPCDIANDPAAYFSGSYVDESGNYALFDVGIATTPCLREVCETFYTITAAEYAAIDKIIVDGVPYMIGAGVPVLNSGIFIPYIGGASTHEPAPGGMMRIYSRFDVPIDFFAGGTAVNKNYNSINCRSCNANKLISCFGIAVNLSISRQQQEPETFTVYTDPYECNECEASVLIESNYGGGADCLGNVYSISQGKTGLLNDYKNTLRIPAVIRNLPSKFGATINDKCNVYKTEITETAELQGTKPFPRFFARMVENVAAGRRFKVDGEEYLIRGEKIFDPFTPPATSTETLKLALEKCPCETYFDCV